MKFRRVLVPTAALASLALTGCTTVEGDSGGSSSPAAVSTPATSSAAPATSQAPTSSEEPTTSDAPSSDASTSATTPSTSAASSSQAASTAKISESDILRYATTHETRSCVSKNLAYVSSAQFCKEDENTIDATYKGQTVYFTTAVTFKSGSSYTYEVSNGSQTKKGQLDSKGTSNADGRAVTLTVKVPMDQTGTYSIKFLENGSQFASDSVAVTVK